MKLGDHLYSHRRTYTHHGIYVGRGQVIHYAGFVRGFETGAIERTSMYGFSNGRNVHVADVGSAKFTRAEIVERAYSKLGEDQYNLLLNNCEHFVHWCLHGRRRSPQVQRAVAKVGSTALLVYRDVKALRDPVVPKKWEELADRHLPAPAAKVVRVVIEKVTPPMPLNDVRFPGDPSRVPSLTSVALKVLGM